MPSSNSYRQATADLSPKIDDNVCTMGAKQLGFQMIRSHYKNRAIFESAELNENNGQWKPMASIVWFITTQKFHSINDMVGGFGTEREAVDFALKAGKAWIDLQPPVPPCRDP